MLRDKKIIVMLVGLEMGGAERYALHIVRHLVREQGARVEVWAFKTAGEFAHVLSEESIPWRIVPWPMSGGRISSLWRFLRALRAARPDIILPYVMPASYVCGLVWKGTGARVCLWMQQDEGRDITGSRWERRSIAGVSGVLSNSRHAAEMLIEKFAIPPQRVRVIRNGVRPEAPQMTREQWRQELQLEDDCFAICMVANLHTFKDHQTLLLAWRIAIETHPNGVLLLAGVPQETAAAVHQLAAELKLGATVRFLGGVPDISGLLGAIELGVFSSRCEGVPNGVLECMAAGLAVAATDIPGIREAVGQEGERFLAPPGDAAALAARIVELWDNAELRREAGRINRQRIEREFGVERLCRETVEVIEAALHKRSVASHDATRAD